MFEPLTRWAQRLAGASQRHRRTVAPVKHGPAGIAEIGHRLYVGGEWEEIGRLQFEFLRDRGLSPHHVLLDVGCGALRGGVHFIPYLEAGNYLGLDKEPALIDLGIANELGQELNERKRPEFVVSDDFEFHRFSKAPQFAVAQSVFTHLTLDRVRRCLERLRDFVPPGCTLYATFRECAEPIDNPDASHDQLRFHYTRRQMEALGTETGWQPRYIGDWNHPRGQKMMEYTAHARIREDRSTAGGVGSASRSRRRAD